MAEQSKRFSEFKTEMMSEIQGMKRAIEQVPILQNKIVALEEENKHLADEMEHTKHQIAALEQQQKARNLIFYGIPGPGGESRDQTETHEPSTHGDTCEKKNDARPPNEPKGK